jgi:hypothetical protein
MISRVLRATGNPARVRTRALFVVTPTTPRFASYNTWPTFGYSILSYIYFIATSIGSHMHWYKYKLVQ